MVKNLFVICILLSSAHIIFTEVIQSETCPPAKGKEALSSVSEVRIDPCPAPGDGLTNPCVVHRGTVATISVDFTPSVLIKRMRASLAYVSKFSELAFAGLEWDGCKSIVDGQKCPLEPSQNYTWSSNITLSPIFPANTYPLKLKITDGNFTPGTILCQKFTIKLE